ncbi:MAG: N5-glutamine methyltransferase family protein [Acidimicrobiales bacterium]
MVRAASVLHAEVSARLARAGCVANEEEASDLIAAASGDPERLEQFVGRRTAGEPTSWIVGQVTFCGRSVIVHPGVYVPRWQTEPLVRRATDLLPRDGVAIDLCTGSGAIAVVLGAERPFARIVATDADPIAVACSRQNGVEVYQGDLAVPVPSDLEAGVDVLTAVVPYVPSEAMHLLPRDVLAFEPSQALDGGPRGMEYLERAALEAVRWLRPGGALLLELGGDQGVEMSRHLARLGFEKIAVLRDDQGDDRGIEGYRPK